MLLFFRNRLLQSVRHVNGLSDTHLIYTVNMLKEKATGYLEENDTAQASEKTFQGCKLALIQYVQRLEKANDFKIVPEHLANPWNYRKFKKLCDIVIKNVDIKLADEINNGWTHAYRFHSEGWTQNNLSVDNVKLSLPYVMRFMEIVEKELPIDRMMALHIKEQLFNSYSKANQAT
ncbi:unnamed protein product [Auanema sp. JU1783]|nr:unnamed protein product [Auanema sp. JU1783]